jgi:hypothetical protein
MLSSFLGVLPILTPPLCLLLYHVLKVQSPCCVCFWVCTMAPAFSGQLVYLQFHEGFLSPSLPRSGCPALFATCLFCYHLLFSFSFFPGWGSVCPGGYADLAQGYLWEYYVLLCSPCDPGLPKRSGHWRLTVAWEPSWFPGVLLKI